MKIKLICGKRTAIGKFLGSFYEQKIENVFNQLITKSDLNGADLKDVDISIFGNVISAGIGQGMARKIALEAGVPQNRPAYSVNMVCGSGMQAIANGCNELKNGASLVLAGGFEFMSNIPYATDTFIRLGKKFGNFEMNDLMIKDGLTDSFSGVHMGVTAENIAKEYNITREHQDKYAVIAHQRALGAVKSDYFKDEIVPISLKDYKGNEYIFEVDEFPNPKATPENLAKLKPSFIKDGTGTVTAANASGINDGAAFVLLATDEYCKQKGINSNIEVVDYVSVGCDPQKMGLGPFYAIKKLLDKTGIDFKDIDVFEINEAFAAQVLGCFELLEKEYNVDEEYLLDHVNPHGSGLGLGHPLGCSGTRIVVTLYHHMLKNDCIYGIATLCIGGGMGIAVLLKKEK